MKSCQFLVSNDDGSKKTEYEGKVQVLELHSEKILDLGSKVEKTTLEMKSGLPDLGQPQFQNPKPQLGYQMPTSCMPGTKAKVTSIPALVVFQQAAAVPGHCHVSAVPVSVPSTGQVQGNQLSI